MDYSSKAAQLAAFVPSMRWAEIHERQYVYVAQCGDLYKIGASKSPDVRMHQIKRKGEPRPRVVIAIAVSGSACMLKYERAYHRQYRAARVHGEWFRLTASDLEELRRQAEHAWRYPLGGREQADERKAAHRRHMRNLLLQRQEVAQKGSAS